LIYNGVDTERFFPRPRANREPLIIGNLARLHRKNDQATLLRALALLEQREGMPPWRCRIAGDGPEAAALASLAVELGVDNRITFEGHVTDPVAYLQGLDIYVQSSIAEGLPNAILEAMACGLPIVATDVGGTRELVEHGRTGWLVTPGNPHALADALAHMLANIDGGRRFGEAGRQLVEERFAIDRMIRDTEALLESLHSPKRL
jgi:glycosyltransferase involved in cell wall biosynthesis